MKRTILFSACALLGALAVSGGTVFEFDWGNSTFYTPQHLDEVDLDTPRLGLFVKRDFQLGSRARDRTLLTQVNKYGNWPK